jgi:homoserine acetyltransferase
MVVRAVPVVPAGLEANPYLIQTLDTRAAPIVSDSNWNGGDYYGRQEPVKGVAEALKLGVLSARHPPLGRQDLRAQVGRGGQESPAGLEQQVRHRRRPRHY